MTFDFTSLGKYLAGSLTKHDNVFYDTPDQTLWGAAGSFIPSKGDLVFGTEELTTYRKNFTGRASTYSGRAFDIPLVNHGLSRDSASVMMIVAGVEFSVADIHRAKIAEQSGMMPIDDFIQTSIESIQVAVNNRMHELVYGGDGSDFFGLVNTPNLNVIDEVGATTATPVHAMTPEAQYAWFQRQIGKFKISSKLPYTSITAYVSDDLFTGLARRFTDNSGDSGLGLLQDQLRGRFLGTLEPITELGASTLEALGLFTPASKKGRLILGDFSNERSVKRHFYALDRTEPFLKDSGFHFGITGWAATSEIAFAVPERFSYVDYTAIA